KVENLALLMADKAVLSLRQGASIHLKLDYLIRLVNPLKRLPNPPFLASRATRTGCLRLLFPIGILGRWSAAVGAVDLQSFAEQADDENENFHQRLGGRRHGLVLSKCLTCLGNGRVDVDVLYLHA